MARVACLEQRRHESPNQPRLLHVGPKQKVALEVHGRLERAKHQATIGETVNSQRVDDADPYSFEGESAGRDGERSLYHQVRLGVRVPAELVELEPRAIFRRKGDIVDPIEVLRMDHLPRRQRMSRRDCAQRREAAEYLMLDAREIDLARSEPQIEFSVYDVIADGCRAHDVEERKSTRLNSSN